MTVFYVYVDISEIERKEQDVSPLIEMVYDLYAYLFPYFAF